MPTLTWIGKQAVVEHHKQVPFHLLRCNPALSVPSNPSSLEDQQGLAAGNLLIQGDNLLALKALLPYYAGQVKCIYIDPPYNTGEESWIYDDKVSSPEIRAWLGQAVGKEAEDLSRHDKWLCMMYPRLVLLRELLAEDGSLWMSIDDNEVHHARAVLDEIFGVNNFIASVVWQKRTSPESRLPLGAAHDYVVVYGKNLEKAKDAINRIPLSSARLQEYKNPDNDPRGPWASRDMTGQVGHAAETQFYELVTPKGKRFSPPSGRCWTVSEETFKKLLADNRIWFGTTGNSRPRIKIFLSESQGATAWTWWRHDEVGHNQEATRELKVILDKGAAFETPKPVRLIERIVQLATNPGDLVLDSFAGSGTTGHAVLQLNRQDGGNRRFILVEMERDIARAITAERLRRVIQGYTWRDQKGNERREEGLGGSFRYCELGPTLFDAAGRIRPEVTYADLAQHVFFIETGQPLPFTPPSLVEPALSLSKGKGAGGSGPLLGVANGIAVYLLYNGVLRDRSSAGGNVLTNAVLTSLPPHDGPKVVYGTGCRLSPERLRQLGITFRQIPYEIKVS